MPRQGKSGHGAAVPVTADTGYFWFFTSTNVELMVKVLDGRGVNGKYWVLYGALSNVQYTITVTDTQTGTVEEVRERQRDSGERGRYVGFLTAEEMTMASASWDRKRAAHLYRRAGFGGRPEELDRAVSLGREGAVSHLVDYDSISTADLDAYLDLFGFDLEGYSERTPGRAGLHPDRWWYMRMQHGPRPLQEKMTLFWHNHFATSIARSSIQLMYAQNQIFRNLGNGALRRSPARGLARPGDAHLAGQREQRQGLPQRELRPGGHGALHDGPRQLHAAGRDGVGPGFHGLDDRYPRTTTASSATRTSTTTASRSFSGSYGDFKGEDIIAILAARPETAAFITAKLARFFLGGDPSPALAQSLQDLYASARAHPRDRPGDSPLRRLRPDRGRARHDQVAHRARRRRLPVAGSRSRTRRTTTDYSAAMGQNPFYPPNVGGWKGGRTWIHTQAYLMRINFAFDLVHQPARRGDVAAYSNFRWDISRFFEDRSFSTPDELIDFLVDRLGMVTAVGFGPAGAARISRRRRDPFVWTPDPSTTTSSGAGRSIS